MSKYYRREQYREKLFVKKLCLKSIRDELLKILPYNYDFKDFLEVFKLYSPCEWEDIVDYCNIKEKNYLRRNQKGLRAVHFYTPEQFLKYHMNLRPSNNALLTGEELWRFKDKLRIKAESKKKRREDKLKKNMVTIQSVCPSYINSLIKLYFDRRRKNALNVNARYMILLEASQFKCDKSVAFLQKVNTCEKNDELRYLAFLSLQKMNVLVWLGKKRKGRKRMSQIKCIDLKKNPTELLHFIYENQHLIQQEYNIFMSHSLLDAQMILQIKSKLNKIGKTVYIDWVNDNVMLDRRNQNEDTWNVLEKRMQQSKQMVYVLTEHSIESPFTEKEVRYFKGLGKDIFVYEPYKNIQRPTYLDGYENIKL